MRYCIVGRFKRDSQGVGVLYFFPCLMFICLFPTEVREFFSCC